MTPKSFRVVARDEDGHNYTVWASEIKMFEGCLAVYGVETTARYGVKYEDGSAPVFYAIPWRDVVIVEGYPK